MMTPDEIFRLAIKIARNHAMYDLNSVAGQELPGEVGLYVTRLLKRLPENPDKPLVFHILLKCIPRVIGRNFFRHAHTGIKDVGKWRRIGRVKLKEGLKVYDQQDPVRDQRHDYLDQCLNSLREPSIRELFRRYLSGQTFEQIDSKLGWRSGTARKKFNRKVSRFKRKLSAKGVRVSSRAEETANRAKRIAELHETEGLSMTDIAERMSLKRASVSKIYHRSKKDEQCHDTL